MKTKKKFWLGLLFGSGIVCLFPAFHFMAIGKIPGGNPLYAALGCFLFAFFPLAVAQAIRGGLFPTKLDLSATLSWVSATLFLLTLILLLPQSTAREWLEDIAALSGCALAIYSWVKAYKKAKK